MKAGACWSYWPIRLAVHLIRLVLWTDRAVWIAGRSRFEIWWRSYDDDPRPKLTRIF